MKFIVTQAHRSEYPNPIRLTRGDEFAVGERHEGPEGWENWRFCTTADTSGWVPEQLIERMRDGRGRALEGFNAREMDVDVGDVLAGGETLNGWIWCTHCSRPDAGWVPRSHLQIFDK